MACKKRRGRHDLANYWMLVIAIAVINLIGISYAFWDEGLQVVTSIRSGKIDPKFDTNKIICDDKNITIKFDDEYTMTVEGEVYADKKTILDFDIANDGTMPAILIEEEIQSSPELKLEYSEQDKTIKMNERGNYKLTIEPDDDEDRLEFEFDIPFEQWSD